MRLVYKTQEISRQPCLRQGLSLQLCFWKGCEVLVRLASCGSGPCMWGYCWSMRPGLLWWMRRKLFSPRHHAPWTLLFLKLRFFFHQSEGIGTTEYPVNKMGWLYYAKKLLFRIDFSREDYIITAQFFSSITYSLFSNTADLLLCSVSLKFSTLEAVLSRNHLLTTVSSPYVLFCQEIQFLIWKISTMS